VTLTFVFDLDNVVVEQHSKYVGHGSCASKVHTHAHTHTWISKLIHSLPVMGFSPGSSVPTNGATEP